MNALLINPLPECKTLCQQTVGLTSFYLELMPKHLQHTHTHTHTDIIVTLQLSPRLI